MNRGRIAILVAALGVLVLVAWLSGVFDSNYSTLDVPDWRVARDDVQGITLHLSGDTLSAERKEGRWMLTSPLSTPADSAFVGRLLDNIADLRFGSVVSTNPARYSNYGVDSTAGDILLRRSEGNLSLVVGNQTSDFLGSFVRFGSDPRVFTTTRPLRLSVDLNQWRDKVVVDMPVNAVTKATVRPADGDAYQLDQTGGAWTITKGDATAAADSASVVRWIRRFSPLRGDGFVDSQEGLEAAGEITFDTSGGQTEIHFLQNDSYLIMRRPTDGALLRVASGRKTSLMPAGDDFSR